MSIYDLKKLEQRESKPVCNEFKSSDRKIPPLGIAFFAGGLTFPQQNQSYASIHPLPGDGSQECQGTHWQTTYRRGFVDGYKAAKSERP